MIYVAYIILIVTETGARSFFKSNNLGWFTCFPVLLALLLVKTFESCRQYSWLMRCHKSNDVDAVRQSRTKVMTIMYRDGEDTTLNV